MNAAPRAASISAVVALVLAAVWLFWPLALGGSTTYVSTHGVSMEPRFHTGDLAILRPADCYDVGDVVAYRSAALDTVVMHRIVAVDGDRLRDPGRQQRLAGRGPPVRRTRSSARSSCGIPHGGRRSRRCVRPASSPLAALAALAVLGAVRAAPRGRHGSRSALRRFRRPSTPRAPAFAMPTRALARQVALISGAVALLAGAAGGVLLALPSTQTDDEHAAGDPAGRSSPTPAPPSPGRPTRTASSRPATRSGRSLAADLTVSFTNTVTGPDLADLRGAMRLDVSVSSADGWSAVPDSSPVVAPGGRDGDRHRRRSTRRRRRRC